MRADIRLINDKQLSDFFGGLPDVFKKDIIVNLYSKVVKPFINDVKSKLSGHSRTGGLVKSIGLKKVKTEGAVLIGARRSGSYKGQTAHLLEEGTDSRSYINKNGTVRKTGKVRGIHFFSETLTEHTDQIFNDFASGFEKELVKYIRKYNKKNG